MQNVATPLENFGIGQPVRRSEDPILVQGQGRYTDDVNVEGQAYAFIVRSPYAHGILNNVDLDAARDMPGVLAAFEGQELIDAGYGLLRCRFNFPNRDGSPMASPKRYALAHEKVRFVGDPVACIIAETYLQAKDAAEVVGLDIEQLPAVILASEGAAEGAPLVFDDVPGNIQLDYSFGDSALVEEAFAGAAHVTRLPLLNQRLVVNAIEPRSALAEFGDEEGYTLHVCSQGVNNLRNQLLGDILPKGEKARVITGQVGGSFGMKFSIYPEYICLMHGARILGRPVKWTDERSSAFMSDQHGRDHEIDAELALDTEGHFLAVRVTGYSNIGGYLTTVGPLMGTRGLVNNLPSLYQTPLIEVATKCVFTNTTPIGAYRGAGRPEANYFMERLVDQAALEMGLDKIDLRRKNLITKDQLPFTSAGGMVYDSGDFEGLLDRALKEADWDGFPARKETSAKKGLLRGRGIGCFLEATAGPMPEQANLRFEADGTVTILTGTLDYGQGHAATFAQILTSRLGVPFDKIRLVQGDTNEVKMGSGSGGSRSTMNSGAYIVEAADIAIERGKLIASHLLEAAQADIEFVRGRFAIAGTDRGLDIMDMAEKLRSGVKLPEGVPTTLNVEHSGKGVAAVFPNGCHIAEVEIDPDTGTTKVVSYYNLNDFGTVINPMLVEGQLHGGIVQSIGQCLMERTVYDSEGQLLTGSFMDYAMPRASDVPSFSYGSHPSPATTNVLGVKGCGEAGCAGGMTSVMNAVHDALADVGVKHIEMPATPLAVWNAIQEARG